MITIYNLTGTQAVSRSKNLRGIISHAGKHGVNVIRVRGETNMKGEYAVQFYFHGGDNAKAEFADWRVLLDVLARTKNLTPDRLTLTEAMYFEAYNAGRLKPIQARGTVVTYA